VDAACRQGGGAALLRRSLENDEVAEAAGLSLATVKRDWTLARAWLHTGATTLVGTHNTNINSLVFGSDGTLYGGSNVLYTLNTATGAASAIGNMGASSSGDLAFVGGKLYLSATAGNDSLRLIDPATGAGSFVGNIGRSSVFGLASPDGSDLYGMSGNSVFEIEPATGAAGPTIYSLAGFSSVYGTTFYGEATPPIPEPSTYALMALGLAVVGLVARRRRVV
jgi:hypothetical protein